MIGILTFYWANDYGALLQSYALKTYLNRHEETVMVPYFPRPLRSRYRLLPYNPAASLPRRCFEVAMKLRPRVFYANLKVKWEMRRFRRKYLTTSRRALESSREIYEWGNEIDVFVAGSDQIWNPEITEGFQEGYFCTFRQWRREKSRYVAYAASIGAKRLPQEYDAALSGLLSWFDVISLREPQSASYIRDLCGKEPSLVLDPVFLLDKTEWEALWRRGKANKRREKGYIAVYYTEYNPAMAQYLQRLEKRTGLEVLILRPKWGMCHWTDRASCVVCGDPVRFLQWIGEAEYVVTNSFHGTALSILFQRPFATFAHSTRGARMTDLLTCTHLTGRLAETADAVERIDESIDWQTAEAALEKEIRRSRAFIEREILKKSGIRQEGSKAGHKRRAAKKSKTEQAQADRKG